MVTEFCNFGKGVIGKKMPADSTLNNMKKTELIKLFHIAQHNYETLEWFYNNAVNVNMEKLNNDKAIRTKAIDEFAELANKKITEFVLAHKNNLDFASGISVAWNIIDEIAEQLKGGVEHG